MPHQSPRWAFYRELPLNRFYRVTLLSRCIIPVHSTRTVVGIIGWTESYWAMTFREMNRFWKNRGKSLRRVCWVELSSIEAVSLSLLIVRYSVDISWEQLVGENFRVHLFLIDTSTNLRKKLFWLEVLFLPMSERSFGISDRPESVKARYFSLENILNVQLDWEDSRCSSRYLDKLMNMTGSLWPTFPLISDRVKPWRNHRNRTTSGKFDIPNYFWGKELIS